MLADGTIDAVSNANKPSSFNTTPDVTRLLLDLKNVEGDYYKRTGTFPIMRVVAFKRSVY
jgi:hypothetical protein